jgi:hypothetical protein
MRAFSLACLRWAEQAPDPSNRQTIVNVARSWLKTAEAIDRTAGQGGGAPPDLRSMLN